MSAAEKRDTGAGGRFRLATAKGIETIRASKEHLLPLSKAANGRQALRQEGWLTATLKQAEA